MVVNIAYMSPPIINTLVIINSVKLNLRDSDFGFLDQMFNIILILFIRFQARLIDFVFTTELDPFGSLVSA